MGPWRSAAYSASRYLTGSYAKEAPELLLLSLLLLLVWPEPEGRSRKAGARAPKQGVRGNFGCRIGRRRFFFKSAEASPAPKAWAGRPEPGCRRSGRTFAV